MSTPKDAVPMDERARCKLCGEPMPEGEEMFFYHGYSGRCPKPPLPKPAVPMDEEFTWKFEDCRFCREGYIPAVNRNGIVSHEWEGKYNMCVRWAYKSITAREAVRPAATREAERAAPIAKSEVVYVVQREGQARSIYATEASAIEDKKELEAKYADVGYEYEVVPWIVQGRAADTDSLPAESAAPDDKERIRNDAYTVALMVIKGAPVDNLPGDVNKVGTWANRFREALNARCPTASVPLERSLRAALQTAAIRLQICHGRMAGCPAEHELIDEVQMFVDEACAALARPEPQAAARSERDNLVERLNKLSDTWEELPKVLICDDDHIHNDDCVVGRDYVRELRAAMLSDAQIISCFDTAAAPATEGLRERLEVALKAVKLPAPPIPYLSQEPAHMGPKSVMVIIDAIMPFLAAESPNAAAPPQEQRLKVLLEDAAEFRHLNEDAMGHDFGNGWRKCPDIDCRECAAALDGEPSAPPQELVELSGYWRRQAASAKGLDSRSQADTWVIGCAEELDAILAKLWPGGR